MVLTHTARHVTYHENTREHLKCIVITKRIFRSLVKGIQGLYVNRFFFFFIYWDLFLFSDLDSFLDKIIDTTKQAKVKSE